jgi:hypothetical protein
MTARRMTAAILGALALLLAPGNDARASAIHLGTITQGPYSDGSRWVAWSPSDSLTETLDTRSWSSYELATPPDCRLSGIAAAGAIFTCDVVGPTAGYPLLMNLGTGTFSRPPLDQLLLPSASGDDSHTWNTAGSQWVAGIASGYHFSGPTYINLRTGRLAPEIFNPHLWADLDRPSMTRSLCAPIVRMRDPDYFDGDPFLPFQYVAPYALSYTNTGQSSLWLQRCGQARRVRVAHCPGGCSALQLTRRAATWIRGPRAYEYHLPRGPALAIPIGARNAAYAIVATRSFAFIALVRLGGNPTARTLIAMPLR